MKLSNVNLPPPLLEIGSGDEGFKLKLKPPDGAARLGLLDAVRSSSIEYVYRVAVSQVAGWEGLSDGAGRAIECKPVSGADRGNIDAVFGAMPLETQSRAVHAIVAFILPDLDAAALKSATGDAGDADPSAPPRGSTPGSASGG